MIERYIRTSCDLGSVILEPGIAWVRNDDCKKIRAQLASMASIVQHVPGDSMDLATAFGDLIRDKFPGRYYFVEVFDAQGGWSQEYLPCGPRPRLLEMSVVRATIDDLIRRIQILEDRR